jgi:hypothetical protein
MNRQEAGRSLVVSGIEAGHFDSGEKRRRRGSDWASPTWERRGQRQVGGREEAGRGSARPFGRRRLVASGGRGTFTWALLAQRPSGATAFVKREKNRVGLLGSLGQKLENNRK